MKNKCICFVNSAKSWGGGEKWHYEIATALNKEGYKTIAITYPKSQLSSRFIEEKIKTYQIKISNLSFLNPLKIIKVWKILTKENVSTLIINLPSDLKLIAPIAKIAGVIKTIYRRGSAIPINNTILNRLIFKKNIDQIIANSEATKNTILEKNPTLFNKENIKVIYNGININYSSTITNKFYEPKKDELIIGNLGRFVEQKNHLFLIQIAAELKKRNVDFKLLLAGTGKLEHKIKKLCKEQKIQDKVIFLGFQKDIKKFMNNIDVFLLPSLWEGFGYVLVEAMFFKCPVIAFNISSNPEIIENNKTGFLTEENNLEEMIEKILLLKDNASLRKEIGKSGEERVIDLFSIKKTILDVKKLIA